MRTGERVTWPVTDGTLTNGSTYQWYMEACDQGVCSAPSPTQVFTINTADAPQPLAATATATITGSQVIATDAITDLANPGSSPQLTGYVDADAAYGQVSQADNRTAWSATLDAATTAAIDQNAPQPLAADAFGHFTAGTDQTMPQLPTGPVRWALANLCPHSKIASACDGRYTNDCTDFVSRAWFFSNFGLSTAIYSPVPTSVKDLDAWYPNRVHKFASYTWAGALYLADFEHQYGGYFYHFLKKSQKTSMIPGGSLVFASMHGTHFFDISHVGIVTKVLGRNLIITQHTRNVTEPMWGATGKSWFGRGVVKVWVVYPI